MSHKVLSALITGLLLCAEGTHARENHDDNVHPNMRGTTWNITVSGKLQEGKDKGTGRLAISTNGICSGSLVMVRAGTVIIEPFTWSWDFNDYRMVGGFKAVNRGWRYPLRFIINVSKDGTKIKGSAVSNGDFGKDKLSFRFKGVLVQ